MSTTTTETGSNAPVKTTNGHQRPKRTAKDAMRKTWPILLCCIAVLFASTFAINYIKALQHTPLKVQISLKTNLSK